MRGIVFLNSDAVKESTVQRSDLFWLGAVLAVSLFLASRSIDSSLNYNESHNLLYATVRTPSELLKIDDMHPPGFYLFMHFWEKFGGRSEVLLRLPSLFFALFSTMLVYRLGLQLFSRVTAVAGAFLFSVSPMQVSASSAIRPYSLLTLAFLVSLLCFTKMLKNNRNSYHALNSLASFAALFVHYHGGFLPLYQCAYLLVRFRETRGVLKKWMMFQGAAAVLYSPFAYIAVTEQLKLVNPIGGAGILTTERLLHLFYSLSPLAQRFYIGLSPYVILAAFFFAGLAVLGAMPLRKNLLMVIYLIVPVGLVAIVSNVARLKFYQPYHFVFLIPAFALLVAQGFEKIGKPGKAALFSVVIFGLLLPVKSPVPDWKECARYLRETTRHGDIIVMGPELPDAVWFYWPDAPIVPFERVITGKGLSSRIWVILVYEGIYYEESAKNLLKDRLSQLGFSQEAVNQEVKNAQILLFVRERSKAEAG